MRLNPLMEVIGIIPAIMGMWIPASAQRSRKSRKSDRKSTRLNSSHSQISYAVFCLKKKKLLRSAPHQQNIIIFSAMTSHGHIAKLIMGMFVVVEDGAVMSVGLISVVSTISHDTIAR